MPTRQKFRAETEDPQRSRAISPARFTGRRRQRKCSEEIDDPYQGTYILLVSDDAENGNSKPVREGCALPLVIAARRIVEDALMSRAGRGQRCRA